MACKRPLVVGSLAAGLLLLALGLAGLLAFDYVLRWQVLKSVALQNGTLAYSQFMAPSVPVRIQFYAFDLLNPQEVMNGERPFVKQNGPFTYAEVRWKSDVSYDELRDWITYKQNRSYIFLRNESVADETWQFTTVNIPLVTLLNSLRFMPDFLQNFVAALVAAFPNETLFPKQSVRDVAFGYHDPLLKFAHQFIPSMVYTDYIGVLAGLNNTYDGVYTISAGNRDPAHLGEIQQFNGSKSLTFWSSDLANSVLGSDGSLAPPFLNQSAFLPAFISDICRSLYGVFDSEVTAAAGLRLWRFTGPDALLANATVNPDNAGYCTPAGNCLPAGLINLTECKRVDGLQVPIVASLPHFLLAAPEVQASVRGLHPDDRGHRTYVDIEPLSGAVLQLYKRLQINMRLEGGTAYTAFAPRLQPLYLPMVWINESAVVDEALAGRLREMLVTPQLVAKAAIAVAMGLGGALTLAAGLLLARTRLRREREELETPQTPGADHPAVNSAAPDGYDAPGGRSDGEDDDGSTLIDHEAPIANA